ncbi:MAG TPA: hypothetical protein G4N92_04375 [Anaerolineae bacterium]|nr:hypothetical protein [Anaerolineae bacterium]
MYLAGDCVIIETNYYEDGKPKAHLFVVILDAKLDHDKTILIPMDKVPVRGFHDSTTELNSGDHDFVDVPTYMNYYYGIIRDKKWIDGKGRKREPPINKIIFQRICDGILKSEHTPPDVYDAYLFRNL